VEIPIKKDGIIGASSIAIPNVKYATVEPITKNRLNMTNIIIYNIEVITAEDNTNANT